MEQFTKIELTEALRAIDSIIHKCEKAQEKFPEGNSHHTLLRNRIKAVYISKALIEDALAKSPNPAAEKRISTELLLSNLDQLHTTNLGVERIKQNLHLNVDDVIGWCKEKIQSPDSIITKRGKNWYIVLDGCEITVNASSYTVITAHEQK